MNRYILSNKYESIKNSISSHFTLQIKDNGYMVIDVCFGIVVFNENYIKLTLPNYYLIVSGLDLSISNYTSTGVIIRGSFHSIEYEKRVEK